MIERRLIISSVFFLLFIFLLLNIYSSHSISPLFLRVVNGEKTAIVEYLKKIKPLPQFKSELEYYRKTYGVKIENQVFKDERVRQEKIAELEAVLKKNNKSRDVLYGLYLLYKAEGNEKKAGEYLKRAREVDPDITDFH